MIFFYLRIVSNNASIYPIRLKEGPQCCKVIIKTNLLHCLWCCKSMVPVLVFVVGFLLSIRNNNRRILNVKMSSEVGNIVSLEKTVKRKAKVRFGISSCHQTLWFLEIYIYSLWEMLQKLCIELRYTRQIRNFGAPKTPLM